MPDVSKDLRAISKMWAKTEPRSFGSGLADDTYRAELVSMTVGKSKKMRLQVESKFRVAKGEHKGHEVSRYDGIENENNVAFFKGYLEVIGCPISEDSEELKSELEDFVDKNDDLFDITLVTKNGFQNIQIGGVAGTVEPDETTEPEEKTGRRNSGNGKRRR
jgi:3-methyladenine DNA glycosylase AlkD